MQVDWLDIGLKVGALLFSIVAMIVAWVRTRRDDVDRRFEGTHTKLIDLDRRVQRIEDTRETLPTKDEFHGIATQLAALNGKLDVLSTELGGHGRMLGRVEAVVSRHEDHLMNRPKS